MKINSKAFTLLELLMVIIVVGILASFAIPVYIDFKEKVVVSEAINTIGTIKRKVKQMALEHADVDNAGLEDFYVYCIDDLGLPRKAEVSRSDIYWVYYVAPGGMFFEKVSIVALRTDKNVDEKYKRTYVAYKYNYENENLKAITTIVIANGNSYTRHPLIPEYVEN